MKNQGRARRTIAAVAGAMGTIALDMVLPGRLENNGIARARGRWAIHLERMHLIKLFAFVNGGATSELAFEFGTLGLLSG